MSSMMSNTSLIRTWPNVLSQINCYFPLFLFIFGTVGNTLNILVLSQRSLRTNSCSWLFLMSSIFNLISILIGLTTRIIADWIYDITDTVGWLCKLRIFVLITSRTIASWLIVLATVDRWLLSCLNVDYREMSSLKNTRRESIIIIVICIILYSPIFYCHDANLINAPLKCYSRTIVCRVFVDQLYTSITTLFPLILMFSFGFMTISNVRKLKRRLHSPLLTQSNRTMDSQERPTRLQSFERYLLIMLLVQIGCFALFTLPQALQQIYSTLTRDVDKSLSQRSIENSLYRITMLLTYLANGMPFYIYTLSGGYVFREGFFTLIRRMIEIFVCRKR